MVLKRGWISRKTPPQARSPIRRSLVALVRKVAVRKVNPKRRRESYERNFGTHAEIIRATPCCVSGLSAPSDPHHVIPRSRGGTAQHLVPLSRVLHEEGHRIGWVSFETKYGVDLEAIAAQLWRQWNAEA